MEPTWKEAVLQVLREANEALHYQEILRKIADEEIRETGGNTPAGTVARICKDLVDASQARRVERGFYQINQDGAEVTQEEKQAASEDVKQEEKYPSRAYGLLWRRDKVNWTGSQNKMWGKGLLGQASEHAEPRDFSEHPGVYLLHQHGRVMYVGQAEKLYARLYQHTRKMDTRICDRWDEFSWFALGEVGKVNKSDEPISDVSEKMIINLLEAVLIEAILPPLNNKRGNNLGTLHKQFHLSN